MPFPTSPGPHDGETSPPQAATESETYDAFLARARRSRDEARATGDYILVETVLADLERRLVAAKARVSAGGSKR